MGQGICPPGICPKQNMVQAFVLLAFVRTNSGSRHLSSWHLSKTKYGSGICPPGICPKQNMVQAFVRRTNAWTIFCFGQMPGGQMPGLHFVSDKCQEDKCLNHI